MTDERLHSTGKFMTASQSKGLDDKVNTGRDSNMLFFENDVQRGNLGGTSLNIFKKIHKDYTDEKCWC